MLHQERRLNVHRSADIVISSSYLDSTGGGGGKQTTSLVKNDGRFYCYELVYKG